jgi:hypothetical protein
MDIHGASCPSSPLESLELLYSMACYSIVAKVLLAVGVMLYVRGPATTLLSCCYQCCCRRCCCAAVCYCYCYCEVLALVGQFACCCCYCC